MTDLVQNIKSKYHLDWINPDILSGSAIFDNEKEKEDSENTIKNKKNLHFALMHINTEGIKYEEVLSSMEQNGLRPATFKELLSWNTWDKKSTVIAPGSLAELPEGKFASCFSLDNYSEPERSFSLKRLCLINTKYQWRGEMYFLGIKDKDK